MIATAISITLTILFFLAIWFTEPQHHYIQSLWNPLSKEDRRKFESVRYSYHDKESSFEFFILSPEWEIIKTDLATTMLHERKNPEGNQIAHTQINDIEITTQLVKYSLTGISFETIVTNNGHPVTSIREANDLTKARLQHLKAVESLAL